VAHLLFDPGTAGFLLAATVVSEDFIPIRCGMPVLLRVVLAELKAFATLDVAVCLLCFELSCIMFLELFY
jgi:hypothetical protein